MSPHHDTPYTGTIEGGGAQSPPPLNPPPSRGKGSIHSRSREAARAGVTMGSALAIAISWSQHQSILWAIVHGFLSWAYVVYYALTRS